MVPTVDMGGFLVIEQQQLRHQVLHANTCSCDLLALDFNTSLEVKKAEEVYYCVIIGIISEVFNVLQKYNPPLFYNKDV